jgi:RNA polymerase sigma-70 factor (ECF subfamily)
MSDAIENAIDLIEREIPRLRRYARSLTTSRDEADDLAQDTLARAVGKVEQWRPGTNMRAWLFTIMHNAHISERRRIARRPRAAMDISPENPGPPQAGNQMDACRLSEVARAYDQLSDDHREVLHLVVIENLSYDEAAEVMDCAVGTVRSRLSRARESLRSILDSGRAAAAVPTAQAARTARALTTAAFP